MMRTDLRAKMLNLIRVSIKMNNNERTLTYQDFLSSRDTLCSAKLAKRIIRRVLRDISCREIYSNLNCESLSHTVLFYPHLLGP